MNVLLPIGGRLGTILSCLSFLFFAGAKDLEATVAIRTVDGRELVGLVDDRTDGQRLWIRREEDRIVLATSVPWSSIVTATIDGAAVEVSALVRLWPQLKSTGPGGLSSQLRGAPFLTNRRILLGRHAPFPVRIESIEIEAVLVNLDRDVEPDGFELTIAAIDVYGRSVPVRGNITARLVGERDVERSGLIRFEELQRWSQPVRLTDFPHGTASYALRFRTVRPEFEGELIPFALLNVRLGVYGQGNFEASIPVAIREFNPFRDQLQKYDGSRFFRDELSEQVHRREIAPPGSGQQAWSRR